MKKLMFTLCIMSILPLAALAKNKPIPNNAFSKPPLRAVGSCKGLCVRMAEEILNREAIQAVNHQTLQGKNAEVVGKILKLGPSILTRFQTAGVSIQKANEYVNSLIAAGLQSKIWDSMTKNNLMGLVFSLNKPGSVRDNKEKLEKINKECKLNAA